jgi:hypothetical protein
MPRVWEEPKVVQEEDPSSYLFLMKRKVSRKHIKRGGATLHIRFP